LQNEKFSIVVDKGGIWIYKPKKNLLKIIKDNEPDIIKQLDVPYTKDEISGLGKKLNLTDKVSDMINGLIHNISISSIAFIQSPILWDYIEKKRGNRNHDMFVPITYEQYVKEIGYLLNGPQTNADDEIGFYVDYIKGTDIDIVIPEKYYKD
jgi:hypothetical protein